MPSATKSQPIIACRGAAAYAGLAYASHNEPGIGRRKSGKGFAYRGAGGELIRDAETLGRIRKLAIPPAWTSVWICPDPNGHIQAVGFDEKGRRQYRYHARFREARDEAKFEHLITFAAALPPLRRRIAADMAEPGLGRRKVLATVVHLLETTMIRVGNLAYAKENNSYGLTTLERRHMKIDGPELRFHFKGKSGRIWNLSVRDRRVARIVKSCQELPGQHLFQYLDQAGERQAITSADVNAYLKEASGSDITAKDFRTWTGTVLAAMALGEFERVDSQASAKKNVTRAIERVSARLGNTPTICRKCYIHPEIVAAYLNGGLLIEVRQSIDCELNDELGSLRPEEAAVLAFLRSRVERELNTRASGAGSPPRAKPARPKPSPARPAMGARRAGPLQPADIPMATR